MAVALVFVLALTGCRASNKQLAAEPAVGVEFVMNTLVEQRWYGEHAQEAYDEIIASLRTLEQKLSLYVETGEIAQLNAAAGKAPVAVSKDVYQLLKAAVACGEASDGAFDLTIAPLTLCWDIAGEHPHIPAQEEIDRARALVDYRKLRLDDQAQTAFLEEPGMQVDLGGVAKGMAASAMREIAQKHGVQGFLSIGGNMMVEGKKPDATDFRIGIRDPRADQTEYIAVLALDGLTMATTGDYERYFIENGVRYHHILDPFTGYPSQSDLISVTVISENGTLADCLSTTIFLQGSEALEHYFARDDCMVLAVTRDKKVYATPALWERLTVDPSKTDYTFCRE
ncbi:MAG: FAD:protein FMN transferase [Oscillospiraceae bacterium]